MNNVVNNIICLNFCLCLDLFCTFPISVSNCTLLMSCLNICFTVVANTINIHLLSTFTSLTNFKIHLIFTKTFIISYYFESSKSLVVKKSNENIFFEKICENCNF